MSHLYRIRLELGRSDGFPEGSAQHGYEFIAPLTGENHIDAKAWHDVKEHCGVRRFWGGDKDRHGMLRHVGRGWRFDYGGDSDDDEPFFKLDAHAFVPGSYVSLTEPDGVLRPFRVAGVEELVTRH